MNLKMVMRRIKRDPLGGQALLVASVLLFCARMVAMAGGIYAAAVFVYPPFGYWAAEQVRAPVFIYLTTCVPPKKDGGAEGAEEWVPDLAEVKDWNHGVLNTPKGITFGELKVLKDRLFLVDKPQAAYSSMDVGQVVDHVQAGDNFTLKDVTLVDCSGRAPDGHGGDICSPR